MSFYFMSFGDILRFSSACMACSCMAPLTPEVMVMRRFDLPPLVMSVCISGLDIFHFSFTALVENLS